MKMPRSPTTSNFNTVQEKMEKIGSGPLCCNMRRREGEGSGVRYNTGLQSYPWGGQKIITCKDVTNTMVPSILDKKNLLKLL